MTTHLPKLNYSLLQIENKILIIRILNITQSPDNQKDDRIHSNGNINFGVMFKNYSNPSVEMKIFHSQSKHSCKLIFFIPFLFD